ncbi:hypothetical protein PV328_001575 [Microctonus aethiopoides]|uniref:Uncharacterized protein n=1 Tax=Microctonus aethiopoides TaxID=144406 RepID=A0AA39FXH3_9HYME|nr:hypothetical protein PV328_001575 [Microctonus aethiopoides]
MADRSLKTLSSHEHERYQSPMPSTPQAPVNVVLTVYNHEIPGIIFLDGSRLTRAQKRGDEADEVETDQLGAMRPQESGYRARDKNNVDKRNGYRSGSRRTTKERENKRKR